MSEQINFEKLRSSFPILDIFADTVDRITLCKLLNTEQKINVLSQLSLYAVKRGDVTIIKEGGKSAFSYNPTAVRANNDLVTIGSKQLDDTVRISGEAVLVMGERFRDDTFSVGIFDNEGGIICQILERSMSAIKSVSES